MPRRISDYPDAFTGWNFVSSIGSVISVAATALFLQIVYLQLVTGKAVFGYPWAVPQLFSDYFRILKDRTSPGLEWALHSPPKPHAFTSLPLQSVSFREFFISSLLLQRVIGSKPKPGSVDGSGPDTVKDSGYYTGTGLTSDNIWSSGPMGPDTPLSLKMEKYQNLVWAKLNGHKISQGDKDWAKDHEWLTTHPEYKKYGMFYTVDWDRNYLPITPVSVFSFAYLRPLLNILMPWLPAALYVALSVFTLFYFDLSWVSSISSYLVDKLGNIGYIIIIVLFTAICNLIRLILMIRRANNSIGKYDGLFNFIATNRLSIVVYSLIVLLSVGLVYCIGDFRFSDLDLVCAFAPTLVLSTGHGSGSGSGLTTDQKVEYLESDADLAPNHEALTVGTTPSDIRDRGDQLIANFEARGDQLIAEIDSKVQDGTIDQNKGDDLKDRVDEAKDGYAETVKQSANVAMENAYGDGSDTEDHIYKDFFPIFPFFIIEIPLLTTIITSLAVMVDGIFVDLIFILQGLLQAYRIYKLPSRVMRMWSLLVIIYNYVYTNRSSIVVYSLVVLLSVGLVYCMGDFRFIEIIGCVKCDAPKAWGLYFQDSVSPQMEALVELHDNIMYYLVAIFFAWGIVIVTISLLGYYWALFQLFSDYFRILKDRTVPGLEWALYNQPKPHAFTSLPLQSKVPAPENGDNNPWENLEPESDNDDGNTDDEEQSNGTESDNDNGYTTDDERVDLHRHQLNKYEELEEIAVKADKGEPLTEEEQKKWDDSDQDLDGESQQLGEPSVRNLELAKEFSENIVRNGGIYVEDYLLPIFGFSFLEIPVLRWLFLFYTLFTNNIYLRFYLHTVYLKLSILGKKLYNLIREKDIVKVYCATLGVLIILLGTVGNSIMCDAPKAWGLYFQDSASPQMEALVELHDNIMYYLVAILLAVGWIQAAIIRNFQSSRSPISNKYLNHGISVPNQKCSKIKWNTLLNFNLYSVRNPLKVRTYSTYISKDNSYYNNGHITPSVVYEDAYSMKKVILKENKGKAGIYMLTNKITGDIYVGQSIDLRKRFIKYFSLSYINSRKELIISRALIKYGYSNFSVTVLEYCNASELDVKEQYYFDKLNPQYNIQKNSGW